MGTKINGPNATYDLVVFEDTEDVRKNQVTAAGLCLQPSHQLEKGPPHLPGLPGQSPYTEAGCPCHPDKGHRSCDSLEARCCPAAHSLSNTIGNSALLVLPLALFLPGGFAAAPPRPPAPCRHQPHAPLVRRSPQHGSGHTAPTAPLLVAVMLGRTGVMFVFTVSTSTPGAPKNTTARTKE